MKFNCRITRSCIYWKPDERETYNFTLDADSLEEAKKILYEEAIRLEIGCPSKLVQDALICVDNEWLSILNEGKIIK